MRRAAFLGHAQGVADDGEGAKAQKVHFEEAHLLQRAHRELGGDDLVVGLKRYIFMHGVARDQYACRVGGGVSGHALQLHGGVDQFFDLFVALVGHAQVLALLERL